MSRLRRTVSSPVLHFALSGLLALAVVGLVAVRLVQREARTEALRDAKNVTRLAGEGIVAPLLSPALLAGDPRALARLDRVVRARVLREPVVRVKVWRGDGTILYADDPRLIGERYPLDDEEQRTRLRGGIQADVSDLSRPENRFEREARRLREVYLGVHPPGGGAPLLFEEYLRDSSIAASGSRIWRDFAPILLGALLLLELTQLPLARSLARRLRRGQREREELLARAVTASEHERRRIARALHDGVVQELAGVSFALSAAAAGAQRDPDASAATLRESGEQVRQSIRQLRTLLVELYPESLHRLGLHGAVSDLLAALPAQQLDAHLDFDDDVEVDDARAALVYRTAQEALRNVVAHAQAHTVHVSFGARNGSAVLEVADDGRGMAPAEDDRPRFGLKMLGDLAREQGGELAVHSDAGQGTTLRLTVERLR